MEDFLDVANGAIGDCFEYIYSYGALADKTVILGKADGWMDGWRMYLYIMSL
jgi:hypothetical protein